MKKIRVIVGTPIYGSDVSSIIEVEDDATEEEIDQLAWDVALENIDFAWEEV